MPRLLDPLSLAVGVSLRAMRHRWRMGNQPRLADVPPVRTPDFRDSGDDFPPEPPPVADLVPGHVVGHQPKARSQRPGIAAPARVGELRNRMVLSPEAEACDGAA